MAVDLFKLQGSVEVNTGKAEADLKRVDVAARRTQSSLAQTDNAGKRAGQGITTGFNQSTASASRFSSVINGLQSKLSSLKAPSLNFGGGSSGGGFGVASLVKSNLITSALSSAMGGLTDAIKEGYQAGIQYNSMLEKASISFTTLLGSTDKAQSHLKALQQFGEATPFEFPDLIKASQRMQAMGFAADNVIPSLRAIGDAVSAVGGGKDELDGVVMALGQMQTKGKVSAEEMNQLAERGIPAWDLLAKAIGKTKEETIKLSEQGRLSGGRAVQGITAMMGERFGGQMDKMSATREGKMSNAQDILNRRLGESTKGAFDLEKQGLEAAAKGLSGQSGEDLAKKMDHILTRMGSNMNPVFEKLASGEYFLQGVNALDFGEKSFDAFKQGQIGQGANYAGQAVGEGIGLKRGSAGEDQVADAVAGALPTTGAMGKFTQFVVGTISDTLQKAESVASAGGKLVGMATGTSIKEGTATALDAHSPSRVMMKLGDDAMAGFGIGFNNAIDGQINRNSEGIKKWARAIADAGGEEFLKAVEEMAARLKIDPNKMMNVMAFESRLNPAAKNPNSSATGLIQFMDSTAGGLDTTTAKLKKMNAIEQLKYVEEYFKQFGKLADSQEALYTAVLAGRPVSNPDSVLFTQGSKKTGRAYSANAALDADKSGTITAAEATAKVLQQGFLDVNASTSKSVGLLDQFSAALDSAKARITSLTDSLASFVGLGGATQAPITRAVPQQSAQSKAAQQHQPQTVQAGAIGSTEVKAKTEILSLSQEANKAAASIGQLRVATKETATTSGAAAQALQSTESQAGKFADAIMDVGKASEKAIDHLAAFKDAFANGFDNLFDDALDGKKLDFKSFGKSLFKGLTSSMISGMTGGQASSPGEFLSKALFGGLSGGGSSGGSGGGIGGGGVPATGGFAGGGGAADILGKAQGLGSAFKPGGMLSKLPGLGKVGGFLGKVPGLSKLGSLFGFGGGGGAAAGAASGAATTGAKAALFSNPITAIIGGALMAAPFIAKLFGKDPLSDYKKHIKSEYGVEASKQMAAKVMQIGQSRFGAEWAKRKIETVRLPEVRDMLSEYSGAFMKGGNSKLFDSRMYSDAFSSVNQFKVKMLNGGRVPGQKRGYDHVPVLMDGGELVISNDQQRRAQSGGMFGKGRDEIAEMLERLAGALDRFESMPADQVVVTGIAKRPGIAAADVRRSFEVRDDHSVRMREILASR